uniref:Uncharacterized protein n=1 Tax=Romanomermis culicivorax TaxID=13658 RepID=A0A915JJA9_ROMCU
MASRQKFKYINDDDTESPTEASQKLEYKNSFAKNSGINLNYKKCSIKSSLSKVKSQSQKLDYSTQVVVTLSKSSRRFAKTYIPGMEVAVLFCLSFISVLLLENSLANSIPLDEKKFENDSALTTGSDNHNKIDIKRDCYSGRTQCQT